MRVAFLVTRLPVPPWRGDQVRAFHHLRCLAPRHDVTCVALVPRAPSAEHVRAVEALGVRVVVVPLGWGGALPALAGGLLGDRRPFQVLLFARHGAGRRVAALLAAERFDLVHAQLVRTAPYLPGREGPPVVVDFIDALSANMARRAGGERGLLAPVAAWEAARLRRFEPSLATRVAGGIVVAEADRAAMGVPGLVVVPNGVDCDGAFRFDPAARRAPRLVLTGNLGYFPNVDAAAWLADEIFPRVRAAVPEATLRFAGARPAAAVRERAERPGISLAAEVPAMAPELAAAAVAMVPLRTGSGLQNKILEAMAVGTPVVATPSAAAAIAAVPGEHLLVADDAEGLAAAAVGLLRDPGRATRMARAARALVELRYRWEASAAGIESVWWSAVAAPGAGSAPRTRE